MAGGTTDWNSATQNFDSMTLTGPGAFTMSAQAAYLEHKCGEHITTQFGFVRTPFGMENMSSRFDSATYYYSTAFTTQHNYRWDADLGVKSTFGGFGNLEVALLEGRSNTANSVADFNMPSAAARWSTDMKMSGMNIMPVISGYTGRFRGGPLDLGLSAGANLKMGMFGANVEYMYTGMSPADVAGDKVKGHNVWIEPMVDLGVMNISAKVDYVNAKTGDGNSNSNWNVSGAVSHDWDKLRIRAAYTTRNLKNGNGPKEQDFRILFGTKF
jgi:hypothetical protein